MADLRDPEQLPGVSRATGVDLARSMASVYDRAEQQIAERIARDLAKGMSSPSWAIDRLFAAGKLRDWTRTLLRRLETDAADEIRYGMLSAYMQGGTEATRALAAASDTLPEWVNRAGVAPGPRIQAALDGKRSELAGAIADMSRTIPGLAALQRMIGSLAMRITGTHLPVLRWADDAYRKVIAETALTDVLLGSTVRRAASQHAWERLLTKGVTGFTDKAGRGWNLASYVEMATRTGVAQAAVEGHLDRLGDAGIDMVIVSNAPQECKRCRPWEGKVLARSGREGARTVLVEHRLTGDAIRIEIAGTVDEAVRAGLLHPNCRHSLSAYLPGVTRIPTDTEDPEGDAARQKLRALERQIRKEKLAQAAVIDPAAQPRLDAAVRATQAQIRQHVKDTEHLGIMRKREREQPDLGNSSGLDAGKQKPKPPAPAPTKPAKAKPTASNDELTTIIEGPTSESPAARKYAAEKVPAEAKPYQRNLDGIADLARAVADIGPDAKRTKLSGGVNAITELVELPDGRRVIHKEGLGSREAESHRRTADAEQLASLVGRAIDAPVARTFRNEPGGIWMEHVDGDIAGRDGWKYFDTPEGTRLGLLDILAANEDRSGGNLIVRAGKLVGIDHGESWVSPRIGDQDVQGAFDRPISAFASPVGGFGPNPLHPDDIAVLRRRLDALRPDFELLGRGDWLDYSLWVLSELAKHAAGPTRLY